MNSSILTRITAGTVVDHYASERPGGPAVYQGTAKVHGSGRGGCYRLEVNQTYFNAHSSLVMPEGHLLPGWR